MKPFENESECITIGGLTIENRLDRVSIYGNIDLTLDQLGLDKARSLTALLLDVLNALESRDLPDELPPSESDVVENPFA